MKNIVKTAHIGLFVKDLKESVDFYSEFLDYELEYYVAEDTSPTLFIAMIKNGDERIELLQPKENPESAEIENRKRDCHVAFQCKDLDAVVAKLRQSGIQTETEEPKLLSDFGLPGNNFRSVFFRGPSGERIELTQLEK